MAKKKLSKKKRRRRLIRRLILLTLLLAFVTTLAIFSPKIVKIIKLAQEAKELVNKSSLDTFMASGTTVIYDTDGNELCTMRESKDMYYVDIGQIPDTLQKSFVVMEDKDFYKHKGIDFKAIIRAVIANTENDEIVQGASTITQQLAKNIFLSQEVTWQRKVKEIFVAWDLEKKYTKDQILEFYLNNRSFHAKDTQPDNAVTHHNLSEDIHKPCVHFRLSVNNSLSHQHFHMLPLVVHHYNHLVCHNLPSLH